MHRAIMVYGPTDRYALEIAMGPWSGDRDRSVHLTQVHKFPANESAELMISTIMSTIQQVESNVGKDFTESFMVMPEEDALSPWSSGFGCAGWVLSYKKGQEYGLYIAKRDGLYDWWLPGGRWFSYLQAKSPTIGDAHLGGIRRSDVAPPPLPNEFLYADPRSHEPVWTSLAIKDVDWETMGAGFPDEEAGIIAERELIRAAGEVAPTLREYFFTLYPALLDQVGPDNIEGIMVARKWDTYTKFTNHILGLRKKLGIEFEHSFSFPHRWSDQLLGRLAELKPKTLSCWIIGGVVYDLDDDNQTEEHLNKGLDAIEALHPDTIVSVVDVHY